MTNEIKPICNDQDHAEALATIEGLWHAEPGTPEHDRLEVLATLVDEYESRRWPIDPPDPIELIEYVMEQRGLTRKEPGSSNRLASTRLGGFEPTPTSDDENGVASARGIWDSGRIPDQTVRAPAMIPG